MYADREDATLTRRDFSQNHDADIHYESFPICTYACAAKSDAEDISDFIGYLANISHMNLFGFYQKASGLDQPSTLRNQAQSSTTQRKCECNIDIV